MIDAPITIHRFTAPQVLEFLRIMAKQMGGVAELAKRTGYDRANLNKIIKGKRRPTARLLAKLSIHEEHSYVWTMSAQSVKADAETGQL
jgi:transcriptional regulator with XRE-family HTH domain